MKKKIIFIVIGIFVLAAAGTAFYVHSALGLVHRAELPVNDSDLGITPAPTENTAQSSTGQDNTKAESSEIVNIALFGLDRRNPDEASRSDSIMIVSIDGKTRNIKITSLMRDMYVQIPGKQDNRINAAYAFGGPALAIKTINTLFGLDIKNYVTIDFDGLTNLIDKVGGIEINVKPEEVNLTGVSSAGQQNLNGKQALAYSRIRHVGNADYERTERQRNVLNLLYRKIRSQGLLKLPGLITELLPYVETSLTDSDILKYSLNVAGFNAENLQQFRLPVDGTFTSSTIRKMMVLVPDIEKNKEKLHEFIYGSK